MGILKRNSHRSKDLTYIPWDIKVALIESSNDRTLNGIASCNITTCGLHEWRVPIHYPKTKPKIITKHDSQTFHIAQCCSSWHDEYNTLTGAFSSSIHISPKKNIEIQLKSSCCSLIILHKDH
ncbi:hypothetical protein TNCT_473901 [Trichonephila clavata]|uniref:Uncharacterized protein n=1 Tax=Trichonephila clavata TaxID=2740835 RepID=A0A8X6LDP3_TRICU|nr:hypothetical protein TNCT_473901 [Trichonephila clavata]